MRAVALRLEGPLQSWGGPTAGDDRPTLDIPTKSGVLGLVAGALGIRRDDMPRLLALHRGFVYGVRVDRAGTRGVDYHTSQGVPRRSGGTFRTVVSKRAYLYDASFVALVVERAAPEPPLEGIQEALRRPVFAPFLGRRACAPSVPVAAALGVIEGEDWTDLFAQVPHGDSATHAEMYVETATKMPHVRRVQAWDTLVGPLSRMFGPTRLYHVRLEPPQPSADTVEPWFTKE